MITNERVPVIYRDYHILITISSTSENMLLLNNNEIYRSYCVIRNCNVFLEVRELLNISRVSASKHQTGLCVRNTDNIPH